MPYVIPPHDHALKPQLQHRIDRKTKPIGALGRLESLALQLGLIQHSLAPEVRSPHIMVFAGDHGAATAGISAYPQEVTWQMVENFLAGGAAINVFSRQFDIGLTVIDAGVNHDFGARPGLIDAKLGFGTANYLDRPAMTVAQVEAALERGRRLAHALAGNGCNVVGFGEMGIGNTASASLVTHCLTGHALAPLVGRGTGLDDAGLMRKRALLERALARGGSPTSPVEVLAEYGGFEMAMMAGAMLGAAERRMTLLIDGFIVTAALLAAHALAPRVLDYCVSCHRSQEAGHAIQLSHLESEPLLALDLRLGEGTGAALALPLLQAAAAFLSEMASFEDAAVSGPAAAPG